MNANTNRIDQAKRGSALIPALMVAALMAMLGLSMLQATLDGAKVVNFQGDEYRLTSAVESVGILATNAMWSGYVASEGGAAGDIASFRSYLNSTGIPQTPGSGPPTADEGIDLLDLAGVPGANAGNPEFDNVNVDALRVVRRDVGDSTHLYVTASASTNRGQGIVNPVLNRAIQLVYTVEPERFSGFDYGVLANNVNCIFCHTVIDSTDRFYNADPEQFNSFDRIKVGTLESLMIRDDGDHNPSNITDWDADSYVAGTLYMRGTLTDHDGDPILGGFADQTFQSYEFDDGLLVQDPTWGDLNPTPFSPATGVPGPGENIYFDYPTAYSDMPDGNLPTHFPPPFPDNGGTDPATGLPSTAGAGNRLVDDFEFYEAAQKAEGSIVAGIINVSAHDYVIDSTSEYADALFTGNSPSLQSSTVGNVILSGTKDNPIVIDGTVAIQGDVVINGYLKGEGTIIASGNIYVPTDLKYLDGITYLDGDPPGDPSGPRTYGIAEDGTKNALGLACGGNMLLGDYLKPSVFSHPDKYDIVTGDSDGDFNFALSELSLFNRGEWAKLQPMLPGPGEDKFNPASWTVVNPTYQGVDYVPRYYNFGPGDEIPVYNLGNIYFDAGTGTWKGDAEVPLRWNPDQLSIWDPNDLSNPALYDQVTGEPVAAVLQLTPKNGWLDDAMQKLAIEYFEGQHEYDAPMEIDALLYTNNAIFGIVHRNDKMRGQLQVNGAMVCADLGVLAPGHKYTGGTGTGSNPPDSPFKIGLRLNYDKRVKDMLNVVNPNQVIIKRTLWNPSANVL